MARDLRIIRKDALYHVTNRCYRGELRLSPDEVVRIFVEGCLARATQRYDVRLIIFVFMGNHFHLLVQTPRANLHAFMLYFQRELSTRLNRFRGERQTNFPERYIHEEIATQEDFEREVARLLCNPVRARLVGSIDDWPGVTSAGMHQTGDTTRTVRHASRAQVSMMSQDGENPDLLRSLESIELRISPPPFWTDLDSAEVQQRIAKLVQAEETRLRNAIEKRGERVRGPSRIKDETHRDKSAAYWRPRKRYICRDPEMISDYREWHDNTTSAYRRCARKWRNDGKFADYPPGTFPPGWTRCLPPTTGEGPPIPWRPVPAAAA